MPAPRRQAFITSLAPLETYSKIADPNTTIVLSTDSEIYRLIKSLPPAAATAPTAPATPPPPESPVPSNP